MTIKTAKALSAALLKGIESGVVTVSESDEFMNKGGGLHCSYKGIWFMVSVYERAYGRNSASVTFQNHCGYIGKLDNYSAQSYTDEILESSAA